jgi:predicted AlkP superfamily phosphohydrolase/phosphomutase
VFHVNSWLEREGYLHWAQAGSEAPRRSSTDVGFAEMTRHVHAIDWSRTVAYCATPSSQGIHIVDRVPGTDSPLPDEARAKVSVDLAAALLELRHPLDGRPMIDEVWTREQAFAGPFQAIGPDVSMILADAGTISILPSEEIFGRREQPRGHHRWEGVFLASGPGIRSASRVEELSIVDVAPLLLHQLGLAVPEDVAGRLPAEIFQDGELERRPPRQAPSAAAPVGPEAAPEELALEPEEKAVLLDRLRALGYVE